MKQRNIFFSKVKKLHAPESPSKRYFYIYSKQFKSNRNQGEKYPENTEVSEKDIDNCHTN